MQLSLTRVEMWQREVDISWMWGGFDLSAGGFNGGTYKHTRHFCQVQKAKGKTISMLQGKDYLWPSAWFSLVDLIETGWYISGIQDELAEQFDKVLQYV